MTADEYRAAIATLGLSQVQAGKRLGADERTSRRWAQGGCPSSVAVALALAVTLKNLGIDPFAIPAVIKAAQKDEKPPGPKAEGLNG